MDTYISLLQTYTGRDKILRTASYVATLISGSVKNEETVEKLVTISRQISNSRVVLRFFDDILMWRITRHWSVEACGSLCSVNFIWYLVVFKNNIKSFWVWFACAQEKHQKTSAYLLWKHLQYKLLLVSLPNSSSLMTVFFMLLSPLGTGKRHHVYDTDAAGDKGELIRFWRQKVEGQGQDQSRYGPIRF